MYGEGAITDEMCQKWFAKFHPGDSSLDNGPQSGRPVGVDNNQVETLIENSQHYTIQEIANILRISKSMKLLVKVKNLPLFHKITIRTFWPPPKKALLFRALFIPT